MSSELSRPDGKLLRLLILFLAVSIDGLLNGAYSLSSFPQCQATNWQRTHRYTTKTQRRSNASVGTAKRNQRRDWCVSAVWPSRINEDHRVWSLEGRHRRRCQ